MASAILNLINPPWPQSCVPQRPRYWIPLLTIGEMLAKWPVAAGVGFVNRVPGSGSLLHGFWGLVRLPLLKRR